MLKKHSNKLETVTSWTKEGWSNRKPTQSEQTSYSVLRCKTGYHSFEYDNNRVASDLDRIQEVQNLIQIGEASSGMDQLSPSLQFILREPDLWYVANGKIMKIVDPLTQVIEFGEWGAEKEDSDVDVFSEEKSAMRTYLEDMKLVTPMDTTEECQDIMGELLETANGEIIASGPMSRVSIGVSCIGEEMDEDTENHTEEDMVSEFKEPTPILHELSSGSQQRIKDLQTTYNALIEDSTCDKEREVLVLTLEQKLDAEASKELCTKLDSPYCGHKYSAPRRKYQYIMTDKESHLTEAATQRKEFFHSMFQEAKSCKSMDALYGPVTEEHYKDAGGQPQVRRGRPGGFSGKIRNMYQHDKELNAEWSMRDTKDELSAFSTQRRELIIRLRKEGKDEEAVRKTVFSWFDREAGKTDSEYDSRGNLVKAGKRWKDSIWRQQRTEALKDLFLTRAMWNSIYKMVNLQKTRIKMTPGSNPNERVAIDLLQKHFKRVQSLSELKAYRLWAEKRTFIWKQKMKSWRDELGVMHTGLDYEWNTYDFELAVTDNLSILNANRWWKSVMKKERFLRSKLELFKKFDESFSLVRETEMDDVVAPCPHVGCEGMAIGRPKFAKLEGERGHLFVECDCGRNVWLIGYKESGANIKTFEEAINNANLSDDFRRERD